MKKNILSLFVLLFLGGTSLMFGQVGIGTTTPKATLDVKALNPTGTTTTPEGLLVPKVDRQRAASMTGVEESTIIYVDNISTGTTSGTAVNINSVGFYYFDNSVWQKIGSGSAPAFQNITGNINTLPSGSTTYTVQKSDYVIITTALGVAGVTVTFPSAGFTAADAGKTVWVYNDNANGGNVFLGVPDGVLVNNPQRGIPFVWTGTRWITVGK